MKKLLLAFSGAVTGLALPLFASAQAFSVSTSTETTNNGAFLTAAYDRVINALGTTGVVVFLIVMAILGVIVWMAVKAPRHVVNS